MKWIERAIKSVMRQTILPEEFIIVNDGSNSEETIALKKLSEIYPFIIIEKANGGQGSARNEGVKASNSEFICFLDQDDIFLEEHIEVLTAAIPKNVDYLGWIYSDLHISDNQGNIIYRNATKKHNPINPKDSIIDLLGRDMFILVSASIIPRKTFNQVGGFDEQFRGYEDDDLFLRIFQQGFANYYIDTALSIWCIHDESTSYSIFYSRSRFRYFNKLALSFPDRPKLRRYFFRDCIVPRFTNSFILEAVESIIHEYNYSSEYVTILSQFSVNVNSNKYISYAFKKKLQLLVWTLSSHPKAFKYIIINITKIPIIGRIFFKNLEKRIPGLEEV
jgi:glycosyltransferase involved in cell wall biosynthesis